MIQKLLLASSSPSRQRLLRNAKIPFTVVEQTAQESFDSVASLHDAVRSIAQQKMSAVVMPEGEAGVEYFVVTADTMGQDSQGNIHTKPQDQDEAFQAIKALSFGSGICATGFCIEKKVFDGEDYKTVELYTDIVATKYWFSMPEEDIPKYLQAVPEYLSISGGVTIEEYGLQFLQAIDGSYSTLLGLPMYEFTHALEKLGFRYE